MPFREMREIDEISSRDRNFIGIEKEFFRGLRIQCNLRISTRRLKLAKRLEDFYKYLRI